MTSHPLYSPDLACCDFFLFPKVKMRLKGKRFAAVQEIQKTTQEALDMMTVDDYRKCPPHIMNVGSKHTVLHS